MTAPEYARTARDRPARLAAALLTAAILLDPIGLFSERQAFVAKMVAAEKKSPVAPNSTVPPARDPEIAVREEYDAALQRGTAEALDLFIARHPTGPLADKARARLRRLSR